MGNHADGWIRSIATNRLGRGTGDGSQGADGVTYPPLIVSGG